MRRGLVGDDVDRRVRLEQLRAASSAALPSTPIDSGRRSSRAATASSHGVLEGVGLDVEVAVVDPALDPALVALDADRDAVVHGHGERLRAAHAAEAGGHGDGPGEGAAEALVGDRRERLEGALQDALGADVDPRARGHLAVHGQPEVLEPAELLPVGPVADQVGVRDQHPRRPLVGAHHADRLAGLHEHGLVVRERGEGADEGVVRLPVARRLAGAAVDDEVLGPLGVLGVEVVHQHPQRRLGLPRRRGQLGAVGGVDGQAGVGRGHASSPITSSTAVRTAPEATSCDGGLDLGREVAVGAGALDPGRAQQRRRRRRSRATAPAAPAGRGPARR